VIGQAAGTAAALCVEHETTPRGVYRSYLDDLQQQLLKDGATIIDLPGHDPRDLARSAAATASSEKTRPEGERMAAANVIDGFARITSTGRTSAWAPDPKQALPQWVELAWPAPQTFNSVHVTFLTRNNARSVSRWRCGRRACGVEWPTCLGTITAATCWRLSVRPPRGCAWCWWSSRATSRACARSASTTSRRGCWRSPAAPRACATCPTSRRKSPGTTAPTWVTGIDPKRLTGIVVDDREAEAVGNWPRSDYTRPYIGCGYAHDENSGKGAKSLRFRPKLPKDGTYEIRLAYSANGNRSAKVPVTIQTADGPKTVHVDQRVKPPIGGHSVSLGKFHLLRATAAVTVTNGGTSGYVTADAVWFVSTGY